MKRKEKKKWKIRSSGAKWVFRQLICCTAIMASFSYQLLTNPKVNPNLISFFFFLYSKSSLYIKDFIFKFQNYLPSTDSYPSITFYKLTRIIGRFVHHRALGFWLSRQWKKTRRWQWLTEALIREFRMFSPSLAPIQVQAPGFKLT